MTEVANIILGLLLLATLADCGLGLNNLDFEIGTIQVINDAIYDMTLLNKVQFVDGHIVVDPAYTPLPKGTSFQFQVMQNMASVTSMFTMPTNESVPQPTNEDVPRSQVILEWSSFASEMKVACMPNCLWVVNDDGFSVVDSEDSRLHFVIGWD